MVYVNPLHDPLYALPLRVNKDGDSGNKAGKIAKLHQLPAPGRFSANPLLHGIKAPRETFWTTHLCEFM